jgi:hypothetical protein
MSLALILALSLRFSAPVIDAVRTGLFMETFTLLDPDRVLFKPSDSDLFVAIQPHYLMGEILSSLPRTNDTEMRHFPGDRFRVVNDEVLLRYESRGGAVVNTWQLPRGLCHNHNIFSTQQREAVITVQETFRDSARICWFLNFRWPVSFTVAFIDGPADARLRIGDNASLADHLIAVEPKKYVSGQLAGQHLIVLDSPPGEIDLSVAVTSSVPFADWTDSPSLFHDRGVSDTRVLPMFIVTVRNAKFWIWGVVYGFVALSLFYGATILFMRPMKRFFFAAVQWSRLSAVVMIAWKLKGE